GWRRRRGRQDPERNEGLGLLRCLFGCGWRECLVGREGDGEREGRGRNRKSAMHGSSFRFGFGFVFPGLSQSEISMHGSFPEAYSCARVTQDRGENDKPSLLSTSEVAVTPEHHFPVEVLHDAVKRQPQH